jgi:hypothetical protein
VVHAAEVLVVMLVVVFAVSRPTPVARLNVGPAGKVAVLQSSESRSRTAINVPV